MTIIEQIKAEIERRITDNTFGAKLELIDILAWLDTLESEKPLGEEYSIETGKYTHTLRIGSQSDIDNLIRQEKQEVERIGSYNIVPYIDDKIAKLQDMWREEKVSFDWDDLKDMIEDVARHFAQWGAEHLKK